MKIFMVVCAVVLCFLIVGCYATTPEQQAAIDKLNTDNAALLTRLADIEKSAKEGKIDPFVAAKAFADASAQVNANVEAIKKIKESTGLGFWATLGLIFHRTVAHGINTLPVSRIPFVGPFLQMLLTGLLGGSKTAVQLAPKPPTT